MLSRAAPTRCRDRRRRPRRGRRNFAVIVIVPVVITFVIVIVVVSCSSSSSSSRSSLSSSCCRYRVVVSSEGLVGRHSGSSRSCRVPTALYLADNAPRSATYCASCRAGILAWRAASRPERPSSWHAVRHSVASVRPGASRRARVVLVIADVIPVRNRRRNRPRPRPTLILGSTAILFGLRESSRASTRVRILLVLRGCTLNVQSRSKLCCETYGFRISNYFHWLRCSG